MSTAVTWSTGDRLVALLGTRAECPTCKGPLDRNADDLLNITVWCPACKTGARTGKPRGPAPVPTQGAAALRPQGETSP